MRRAVSRSPAAVSTSRLTTLSAVRPYLSAREPQALLPIEPPMLARECVEGSGPNRRPCPAAAAVMSSRIAPGSTTAVRASGIDRQDPVQVLREVEHDTGSDGVARDGGAGPPAGDRHAGPPGDVQRGGRLVDVPGEDHHARHDPVVRRVGGVLGPAPGRVVDLGQPGAAQRRGQVTWRHGGGRDVPSARAVVMVPDAICPTAASGRTCAPRRGRGCAAGPAAA